MRRLPARWAVVTAALAVLPAPAGAHTVDAGRLELRAGEAPAPLDVEVIALLDGRVRFLARRRLDPGEGLTVDLPLAPAERANVHVRGRRPGSPVLGPEVFSQSVPLERGRVRVATVVPAAPAVRPADGCRPAPARPAPDGAQLVSEVEADVDGDGDPEPARVWSDVEGGVRRWWLAAEGADPVLLAAPPGFDGGRPETGVALMGAADVDADGADELVVSTGSTGHTRTLQLWGRRGCVLAAVGVAGRPGPATFPVGASATSKSGLSCLYVDGARLAAWRADAAGEDVYTVTVTEHRWRGPHLLDEGVTWSWTVPAADDWTLLEAGGFRCGRPTHRLDLAATGPAPVPAAPAHTG